LRLFAAGTLILNKGISGVRALARFEVCFRRLDERVDASDVVGDAKLLLCAVVRHVSNLAENFAFFPTLIVHAHDGPHASDVAARIATIQRVRVVQINCKLQRLLGRLGPLENLLRPIHSTKAVHLTSITQLSLGGVPQIVVRLRPLEFFERVQVRTLVTRMQAKRVLGPVVLLSLNLIVLRAVVAKVVGQLSTNDELFEERLIRGRRRLSDGFLCLERASLTRNLPKVQPRRQPAQRLRLGWIVALLVQLHA